MVQRLDVEKLFFQKGIPIEPFEVGIEATTSAIALGFSFLLPQVVLLFHYECLHESNSIEKNRTFYHWIE